MLIQLTVLVLTLIEFETVIKFAIMYLSRNNKKKSKTQIQVPLAE